MTSKSIARLLIALSTAISIGCGTGTAIATAFSTDQSDVWSAANESGWGIQFVQTGSAIFATMYVYAPSGEPTWYTATLEAQPTPSTWSGDLIATTGPWFGAVSFDPALVTRRKVGTMTWNPRSVESGTLTYAVDGVPVTKTIYRYALRIDDFRGTYGIWIKLDSSGCALPVGTGYMIAEARVSQTANGLIVTTVAASPDTVVTCTWTGNYTQAGHFAQSQGTFSCSSGISGTHTFYEMAVQQHAVSGRMAFSDGAGCTATGALGGIRE
jgi:hypothetical protein